MNHSETARWMAMGQIEKRLVDKSSDLAAYRAGMLRLGSDEARELVREVEALKVAVANVKAA